MSIKQTLLKIVLYINLGLGFSCIAQELNIPDIGTAGIQGLSIQKEQQIGDYFMRTARAYLPIIEDPVLNEYLDSVGNKLLINAQNVYFPFEFFIVNDPNLNAAAFLGGKVQVNTGLFIYSDTEDEFASVLAHEISHVTQRHIARFIEAQATQSNLSIAGIVGAIAMSLINPTFGMAALSTSVGLSAQTKINFTRDNEYEADRIGINLLYQSGFNPQGTTDMFKKLLSMQGNLNPAFTLLIDHPLSQERIAEANYRLHSLEKRKNSTNPNFYFAKARVDVRFSRRDLNDFKANLIANNEKYNQYYRLYALALIALEQNDISTGFDYLSTLENLNSQFNRNIFILDVKTDLDLKVKNYNSAISRLQSFAKRSPNNKAIIINLANAYMEAGQYKNASNLIEKYLLTNKVDTISLEMLQESLYKQNRQCEATQAKGELLFNRANYNGAIALFNQALQICHNNLEKEKIKARVVEIANQRAFDESLNQQ